MNIDINSGHILDLLLKISVYSRQLAVFLNSYLFFFLISAAPVEALEIIPYDWSGQNGMMSQNGRLIWNRDWTSGPLVFDGTFLNYPLRFGSSYLESFRPVSYGLLPSFAEIPDSSIVTNSFDYRKGDYLYDQLEINANFGDGTRLIRWNGFKRTYGGTFGQFVQPGGYLSPNQQSYKVDYLSKTSAEQVYASVAQFITNSGVWDTVANGLHKDRVISGGIYYIKPFGSWVWSLQGSRFVQKYRLDLPSLPEFSNRHLNRDHIHSRLTYTGSDSKQKYLGIVLDGQSLSRPDTLDFRKRKWSTIYVGINTERLTINLGATLSGFKEIGPALIFQYNPSFDLIDFSLNLKVETQPEHLEKWNTSSGMFEKWISGGIGLMRHGDKFSVNANIYGVIVGNYNENYQYYSGTEKEDAPGFLSGKLQAQWTFFREWMISGGYRHTVSSGSISDGIGDHLNFEISGREFLFRSNMDASVRLGIEGLLNRDPEFGFDPFFAMPFVTDDPGMALPDYWVVQFEASAIVSTVTFNWKVQNVFNAAESIVKKALPNLSDDSIWIRNNHRFLPMGQLVSFGVVWNFKN